MKLPLLFLALTNLCSSITAQNRNEYHCGRSHRSLPQTKVTVATPEEDDYDIKYVKLDLQLDNMSGSIRGMVRTDARVTAGSMNSYAFELHDVMIIDSVLVNGQVVTVQTIPTSTPGFPTVTRKAALPAPLGQNALFQAEVYYHSPYLPAGNVLYGRGIINSASNFGNFTYTFSEPYGANLWWPCKQSLRDKIDSADIWVTVPDSLKAASNGVLRQVTIPVAGFKRYEWHSGQPIDYYLIFLAAGNYMDYSYYQHFTGSADSVLIQSFLYNDPGFSAAYIPQIHYMGWYLDHFSGYLGRYPFWKEKYGACFAPFAGGMEHQTMSLVTDSAMLIHELAHQWFGDNVTCGTWKDTWLNEGWATYVGTEEPSTPLNPSLWQFLHQSITSDPGGSVYRYDTSGVTGDIFDYRLVYEKGAAVAHMLRYMAPVDSLFWLAIRDYQALFSGRTATTADMQLVFENRYNRPLDTFFNQWIYQEGYPTYQVRYMQTGSQVFLEVQQSPSVPASVSCFVMPLEIRLRSPQGDTTIKIWNNSNVQMVVVDWSHPLYSIAPVRVDPDNWIIKKTGPPVKDTTLAAAGPTRRELSVYPNPADAAWELNDLAPGTGLRLFDALGKMVWQETSQSAHQSIPAQTLRPGVYFLQLTDRAGRKSYLKLQKK